MTKEIYTIGYVGRTPEEIKAIVDDLGACLVDIRYSPRSRQPQWSRKQLLALLGEKYLHLREWGNAAYKTGGPIQISDFEAGRAVIDRLEAPAILMCACSDATTCHRSVVAEQLRRLGYRCREIGEKVPDQGWLRRLWERLF